MTFTLGPRAAQAGYRILQYDSLDSTNSEAMRLARAGEAGPLWIATREQTAGRGRRGRNWVTVPGNLATSLLIREALAPAEAATLSFVAALAAREACHSLAPGVHLTLKWPNDLLADGRKLGGLLLESEARHDSLAVVLGFGLNLASAPAGMSFPATSLTALGLTVSPEAAFTALTDAWDRNLELWRSQGFGEIRRRWLLHAEGIGQPASVVIGDRQESGIFETLDEQGRLVLRLPDGGARFISAGDVYFGDAACVGAAS
jgi:BirA family biotin operon repressor/biotin-[acetyl-CoA-carboxylase] ligase